MNKLRFTTGSIFDLVDDIFNDNLFNTTESELSTSVKYDIIENEVGYEVDVMLPGFKKEDVKIEVDKGILTIKGERKIDEKIKFNRKGSFFGKFEKSFELPKNIIDNKIDASFVDGVLKIEIPKDVKKELSKFIAIN